MNAKSLSYFYSSYLPTFQKDKTTSNPPPAGPASRCLVAAELLAVYAFVYSLAVIHAWTPDAYPQGTGHGTPAGWPSREPEGLTRPPPPPSGEGNDEGNEGGGATPPLHPRRQRRGGGEAAPPPGIAEHQVRISPPHQRGRGSDSYTQSARIKTADPDLLGSRGVAAWIAIFARFSGSSKYFCHQAGFRGKYATILIVDFTGRKWVLPA